MFEFEDKKPPIGIIPKWVADARRKQEIKDCIIRYLEADKPLLHEWVAEYNQLTK